MTGNHERLTFSSKETLVDLWRGFGFDLVFPGASRDSRSLEATLSKAPSTSRYLVSLFVITCCINSARARSPRLSSIIYDTL